MRTARAHFPTRRSTFRSASHVTTTLYDLMEALRRTVGDKREDLVASIVMHLISSGRIKHTGRRF